MSKFLSDFKYWVGFFIKRREGSDSTFVIENQKRGGRHHQFKDDCHDLFTKIKLICRLGRATIMKFRGRRSFFLWRKQTHFFKFRAREVLPILKVPPPTFTNFELKWGGRRPYFDDGSPLCYEKLKIIEGVDVVHQTWGRPPTFHKNVKTWNTPNFMEISNLQSVPLQKPWIYDYLT